MFYHLPFHPELSSTNVTSITSYMCLFMWKRQLKHWYVKYVKHVSRRKKGNRKTHATKGTKLFWFPINKIKIPDIFYKIIKFLGMSWASVIAHKHVLLLIIWVETAPSKENLLKPKAEDLAKVAGKKEILL